MSTYPLVLIPKLLADFRQSAGTNLSDSPIYFQEIDRTPATSTSVVHKPPKWVRWLGVGLAALGIAQAGTLLGGVFFATGTGLIAWSWFRKKTLIEVRHNKSVPVSRPLALSESERRKAQLRELAKLMQGRVLLPTGTSNAPVGASEKQFGEVLNRYFPGRVFPQMEVPIPDFLHNYSTDFCLSIPEVNIWIDIEIDEPYDYKTGKPTHCWDDGRDANRNTFFLQNGWVVIRFSEEQVVHHPESCCKEIASVIKKLTGITAFYNALENVLQLNPSPLWSKRQAKQMAKAKARDKYLKSLKLKIN